MSQHELLTNAVTLTRAMAAAAAAGDWIEAARVAELRSPVIMQLQNDRDSATLQAARDIQALDASLMQTAEAARMSLGEGFREATARIDAASRYQQAARL
ncbi:MULTISPECIES: flagellar protein FliT [unclassified Caballeronia]|uniref:flagellar protein FliT n=1 Tax=unclassified Caballeronia TaxID=2646786 RepID=UPI002864FAAF|nr:MULTISPECIES: flagellar protein FliT [unclassified Caballeronia]MDR5736920.1 flagellar protein FliT [Caballeronia sp. LZ016]MDR5810548.1 flagellar protein FliT [Caballeronia sp. LZ019]